MLSRSNTVTSGIKVEGYTAKAVHWWSKYDNGKSLFMFSIEHPTRQMCGRIVTTAAFDNFILFCILVGTIVMALSTPAVKGTKLQDIFDFIDLCTNFIFTMEMSLRVVWLGFYMSETAYLRDPSGWNQLDFATVIFGWLALIPDMPNMKSFRGFRALRAVKGVRALSYCSAVLESLGAAMPLFTDVFAVTAFLMLIFAIMGVQLFAGAMRRNCITKTDDYPSANIPNYTASEDMMEPEWGCGEDLYGHTEDYDKDLYSKVGFTCPRNFVCNSGDNPMEGNLAFDNVMIAAFTIFQMFTLEGWTGVMYQCQFAEAGESSYYFVIIILLFGFIIVNLYIAVIVQTFAKIRRTRDREEKMDLVKAGKLIMNEDGTFTTANPLAALSMEMQPLHGSEETGAGQIKTFLTSLNLQVYHEGIITLVDSVDEIWLLSQEDLAAIGMKLVHIRRLMEATKAPAAFHDPLAIAASGPDPAAPSGKTPAEEMFAFLRAHHLEQYHSKLVKLVDSLDELAKLSQQDFEYAGLKLAHAKQLVLFLEDRRIAMPQQGEELLNPALIAVLGGESVGMWRARVSRSNAFWRTKFGACLLYIWYRQDPMVDEEDPPPPAPRTKFTDPYQWDNRYGHILSSVAWEVFISVAIIINIITMSLNYAFAPDEYNQMLKHFELIFLAIFATEMGLKFSGMGGLKYYFAEAFNQFDFVLVTSSVPSAISTIMGTEPFVNLSMLRVMKMLRMLKLLRKMRQLLLVVAQAGKPIGNLVLFILFTLSIFGIFGMALFGGYMCEENGWGEDCPWELTPRTKFSTFGLSVFALFQCMTGEDWNTIMMNAMRESPGFGAFYFLTFFILANYILMEMFCAVILENFQLKREEKDQLQKELLDVRKKKADAAKALAEGVDKALAAQRAEAQAEAEREEAEKREQKIRAKNEAAASGAEVAEEEAPKKTPEQIDKEAKLKAMKEEEMRQKIQQELKSQQEDIAVPEIGGVGEEYLEDQPGNSGKMVLDALDDGPKEKKKKQSGPPVVIVEKSCYFFSTENPIREICYKICQSSAFDAAMLITICTSSVVLALDTPYKKRPDIQTLIDIADPAILGIFTVEFVVRVISNGFCGKPSAYISDSWNKLDFFVLTFSWLCVVATDIPGAFARTIRIGRAIRPLRMINQNERIQIVFNALFMAMPDILNVCFLLIFVIFMFSVMGMGFFLGVFQNCNNDVKYKAECAGVFDNEDFMAPVVWSTPNYNFDNVFNGILTLYEVSTLEGWPDVLYSCTDAVAVDEQPSRDTQWYMWWYIVMYICIAPFFVINLVVGVIIEKFNQITGRGLLTEEQRMFKDTLLQAMLHDESCPLERPQGYVRGICYSLCMNKNFETVILVLVIVNSALMATEHFQQPDSWTSMLEVMNLAFTLVFAAEASVKLIGIGPRSYFDDGWNVMDFGIVIGCLVMIPLDGIVNLQALRPFRLLMIFRMVKRAKGIRLMVCTLLMSLPALFNVACLLGLAFFIYAVLGMSQYANVRFGDELNEFANFRGFDSALLLLVRMTTGEAWNSVMHDCMVSFPRCTDFVGRTLNGWPTDDTLDNVDAYTSIFRNDYWLPNDCGSKFGTIAFFISFQIVGNYMVINLFVAVILDNYAFMANVGDAEISEFVLSKFKTQWYLITLKDKHAKQHLGKYMKAAKTREFLERLGAPLGIVVWDSEGTKKYKTIKEEVRLFSTPGMGISYRRMQYVLCLHAMNIDPACEMPLDEHEAREEAMFKIAQERAAAMLQGAWRGKQGRAKLGVTKGVSKSDKDQKADSFKKKFADLMKNPQAMKSLPPPPGAAAPPPAGAPPPPTAAAKAAPAAAPATGLSPGIQPTADDTSKTAEVKNVFRERAAQRKAARDAKQGA